MPGKMDLSIAERRARSERARELHRAGVFGGKEAGRKGGIATATRRQAPRPPEDMSGWNKDRLLGALHDVLRDLNTGYLRLKVASYDDPVAADIRDLLGITYAPVTSQMPWTLQGASSHGDHPKEINITSLLDWLDENTNTTKETAS